MLRRLSFGLVFLLFTELLTSCFTGVESTKKISDKDVEKVVSKNTSSKIPENTLSQYKDSVQNWSHGRKFYVTDDQIRLLFNNSTSYNLDTLKLDGKVLTYTGYSIGGVLDNRKTINLEFCYGPNKFVYSTNKEMNEFDSNFKIPFLIDYDMVSFYSAQMSGNDFWIKTPIWYDTKNEKMLKGRQFIKVHINAVEPGNKVFPLKVVFTPVDSNNKSFVWLATDDMMMKNRDFNSIFSSQDLRALYKSITDENWNNITHGKVAIGMTKSECSLALGTPKQTRQNPTYDGLNEIWYYDGGMFLLFADGLLKDYRK